MQRAGTMAVKRFFQEISGTPEIFSSPTKLLISGRSFSFMSSQKDPALELSLTRNRRWIVNNQIKNIILRYPNQVVPIWLLQKKFKTLDLQGKALNWVKKYPRCFEVYLDNGDYYCKLTKQMMSLVDEEVSVQDEQEPVIVERLAKLLLMSSNRKLNVLKLNEFKRIFGFPDDFLVRILPKYPEMFRLVSYGGRQSSMELELVSWNPTLAVSVIETLAKERKTEPSFTCSLPISWVRAWEKFHEFSATPYISPYTMSVREFREGSTEMEKRTVGLVHELLSLTLWKKVSIMKLTHFRREFKLPEKLNVILLKHPGIFYVSSKYQSHTVLLREGYNGSTLMNKDPLVIVKEKFGDLMQEGRSEFNRRQHAVNLETKKDKDMLLLKSSNRGIRGTAKASEQDDSIGKQGALHDPEERERFYKDLFDDDEAPP
ncbi:hypothetical protein MKW94_019319 [Papaver nudicaule]|uniref:PORR domain-containing protein n=1 Tax=Papaver nudicaule TaxID=74823 RepID=A0AA41S8G6_PAPNU|nr:hypothetical protein [Papaver nudicaule]